MYSNLQNFAGQGEIIVMAGAGVSAGNPSALPGWKAANAAIVKVLRRRLESAINRPGWLSKLDPVIDAERDEDRFPPDYQAQIIEEMCGDRYFRALQALDVDAFNAGHDGIAALAAAGAVRAVVTTNFDRLIELALDKRGVKYVVAYDDDGYVEMRQRLTARVREPLPIIKIHGCVSDHKSMIDTLKQRKRGRSQHLQECLDALQSGYWIYLGFSAADLETDRGYLGLVAGAAKSEGATYIVYPGNPDLGKGAKILMDAYGDRGRKEVIHIGAYLTGACRALEIPEPDPIPEDVALGTAQFQEKLESWADGLSPAAAGLCLSAILEAIGQAEPAVRILDRLVRKELLDERDTADFRALQLHYGRLGAAWGRFIAVADLGGAASNASVETTQSLLRLKETEQGFAAISWLTCLWLWLNEGKQATDLAVELIQGIIDNRWGRIQPRTDEEVVDAWLSAVQVCILNSHSYSVTLVVKSTNIVLDRTIRIGDVVRTARAAALSCLALAETDEDVPTVLEQYQEAFEEVERVGDGFAMGMRALALGRWYVGRGGLKLARDTDSASVARKSLAYLTEAVRCFRNQGMDPWELFTLVQQAKAYTDLQQLDDMKACLNDATTGLERFPILASHVYETEWQVRNFVGDENADESFQLALEAAQKSGLFARRETLMQYMNQTE